MRSAPHDHHSRPPNARRNHPRPSRAVSPARGDGMTRPLITAILARRRHGGRGQPIAADGRVQRLTGATLCDGTRSDHGGLKAGTPAPSKIFPMERGRSATPALSPRVGNSQECGRARAMLIQVKALGPLSPADSALVRALAAGNAERAAMGGAL